MALLRSSLIVRTKLRPPRLSSDVVTRDSLVERLEESRVLPMALVSAPGGYGKTTLVASWLASAEASYAWLTLDEHDDELGVFLEYLVAAVRTVVPDACDETLNVARSATSGDLDEVYALLLNELDSLPRNVTLVLDEMHWIRSLEVLELMATLLRHPPAPLHLVVISRFDPALPLARLRALGQLIEVREQDLRFTPDEVARYLSFGQGEELVLTSKERDRLLATTEGWAVGLQLARSRLRLGECAEVVLGRLGVGAGDLYRYLVDEVLATLSESRRSQLFAVSVLDRFCAPLCRAVLAETVSEVEAEPFLEWAQGQGLFVQPLDDDEHWFRFHPLFREVLEQELRKSWGREALAELHQRAGRWLEDYGVFEEALDHYEAAADEAAAINLVEGHRRDLMSAEGWSRLQRWLERLPEEARRQRPELLLARAWIQEDRMDYLGLIETVRELERKAEVQEPGVSDRWEGELDVLRAISLYFEFDGAAMVELTGRALERLPEDLLHARGMALALHAWGLHMEGDLAAAEKAVLSTLADERYRDTTVHGFGLAALGFVYWMEGDLDRLERTAEELLAVAESRGLRKSAGYARYLLGVAHLERGDRDEAEATLGPLVRERIPADVANAFHGVFAMALSLSERGDRDRAHELLRSATARALSMSHAELLALCEAFAAELALCEGRIAETTEWVIRFEPSVVGLRNRLFQPELTYVRALLLGGADEALARAESLLGELSTHLSQIHHRRGLVEVALLESLVRWRRSEQAGALERLAWAVGEAAPRSLRRPFEELASLIDPLLQEGELDPEMRAFLETTRPGQRETAQATSSQRSGAAETNDRLVEPLTDRELDVLERLAERLSDKEIAAELGIASKTVKRHNSNLFSKLGVHGRREAVERARELGLLLESARRR